MGRKNPSDIEGGRSLSGQASNAQRERLAGGEKRAGVRYQANELAVRLADVGVESGHSRERMIEVR